MPLTKLVAPQATYIPSDNKVVLFKEKGNTADIIKAIKAADTTGDSYVQQVAADLAGADVAETCYNLYNYVTGTIPYKEDPKGVQVVQQPGALYKNRYAGLDGTGNGGDCKSMSLFCASVLKALGIYNFKYRFIANNAGDDVHHVYLVVDYTDANGNKVYIPLDCTLDEFGVETPYAKKTDMPPSVPAQAPHVGEFNLFKIGAANGIGEIVNDAEQAIWAAEHTDLEKNFWGKAQMLKIEGMIDVFKMWQSKPIRYSAFQKAFYKNYLSFLDMGSVLLYYYWNQKRIISYSVCRQNVSQDAPIPFPADYAAKRETAQQFFDAFLTIGLSDAHIMELCNLGCYRKYGVGMNYLLYRSYCLVLYGQPFKPHYGIPYWDNQTGTLVNNNAPDLAAVGDIAVCLPAQGGISRPFGQPYWSTGGHVIANGADNATTEKFYNDNPRPGTPVGNTQIMVRGVIVNNGAGVPWDDQKSALVTYNKWCSGNMVMLPQIVGIKSMAATPSVGEPITLGVTAIVGIIVGVITALATVATVIAKLVEMFKNPGESADKIPLPLQDFKWDYQTSDGCIIGHPVALGMGNVQTVKMCNGQITEVNPDMNNPANQPPDPGNFFTGPMTTKKKLLLGGAAVAAAGVGLLMLGDGKQSKGVSGVRRKKQKLFKKKRK